MDLSNRPGPRIIAVREAQLSRHSESVDHDGKIDEYVRIMPCARVAFTYRSVAAKHTMSYYPLPALALRCLQGSSFHVFR